MFHSFLLRPVNRVGSSGGKFLVAVRDLGSSSGLPLLQLATSGSGPLASQTPQRLFADFQGVALAGAGYFDNLPGNELRDRVLTVRKLEDAQGLLVRGRHGRDRFGLKGHSLENSVNRHDEASESQPVMKHRAPNRIQ